MFLYFDQPGEWIEVEPIPFMNPKTKIHLQKVQITFNHLHHRKHSMRSVKDIVYEQSKQGLVKASLLCQNLSPLIRAAIHPDGAAPEPGDLNLFVRSPR